jgi:menaquinone-dependent protoporphyrinogen oxidase
VAIMMAQGINTPDRAYGVKVLVSAASMHGATAEIAQAIAEELTGQGLTVTVIPPGDVRAIDGYDAVIIGSAVYTGHWLDPAKDLVNWFGDALTGRPVWLFSSGPVGKPSGKLARAMGNDPVEVAAMAAAIQPPEHRMFAGKLDRHLLSRPQRAALLIFRGLDGDFRDWAEVRQWADGIAHQLTVSPPVPAG